MRYDLESFFDTMIENVLTDGKTRKLDGYLELALKLHGNFEEKTDGTYFCAAAPILSKTESEIRCAWPTDYGPETLHCRLWASVSKITTIETYTPNADRTIAATIYPPAA